MDITSANFDNIMQKSAEKPVLLDFWASWCGPCRMLAPEIDKLEEEAGDSAIIGKINVDEQTELSEKFGITSIPTLVIIKDNKIISKSLGYKSLDQLKNMLGLD